MPTDTAAPPATAGLATGRTSPGGDPAARDGDELIRVAAQGRTDTLTDREHEDLLAYFIGNGELPGDTSPVPIEWTIGEGNAARTNTWRFRRIRWEEWHDAQTRATNETTSVFDGYEAASYVVARALVEPALGPWLQRLITTDGEKAPRDAAELLRRMFATQAGVLLSMSADIRRISKLSVEGGYTRTLGEEVQAAKA
jgi:hypothetical protein